MSLTGKVALITGARRGIGEAIAQRFAAEGAAVGLADIAQDEVESVAERIEASHPGQTLALAFDVVDALQWRTAVNALVERFGGVDILVNNAGIYQRKGLEEIDESEWDAVMAVNAKGPFLGAKTVMPHMRARGGGSIVNISSTAGIRASVATHYGASKGCLLYTSPSPRD